MRFGGWSPKSVCAKELTYECDVSRYLDGKYQTSSQSMYASAMEATDTSPDLTSNYINVTGCSPGRQRRCGGAERFCQWSFTLAYQYFRIYSPTATSVSQFYWLIHHPSRLASSQQPSDR